MRRDTKRLLPLRSHWMSKMRGQTNSLLPPARLQRRCIEQHGLVQRARAVSDLGDFSRCGRIDTQLHDLIGVDRRVG